MIFGADTQNKNLKDAANKPKDTSNRTVTANKYAARVSSSKNTSLGSDRSSQQTVSSESRKDIRGSDKIKGSYEGLDKSSSGYIIMNGTGYDNKSLQGARNFKNFASHNNINFGQESFTNRNSLDIINNMSGIAQANSSSDKINQINKKNRLF